MKTLTRFINPVFEAQLDQAKYEVVENEVIKANDLEGLTISGSLFSLTTFTGVTFKSCVFFGTRLENCIFIGCKFIDCKFEFSHILHCKFETTVFENCNWEFSTIKDNSFNHGRFDVKTQFLLNKAANRQENCICPLPNSWQEAEELLIETEQRVEEESPNQWGTSLVNFLKSAA
ncbi:pentapeptide repeat-containing protein [Bacteriovorax sp. DB6_IX]|uniref:pentapeptide repeat-containing protein n=1 Tax=Bacteriovorax sp. DB6_IX TaxID=1353530 RepID=UPI00038A1C78|nr:pentapeptide repeat-containing protein [Bacteriovorax sp. DB6_IX]EQC45965.1 pentapeptide repeat protein [Bacteriovorax sp. DB6_IX]